MCFAQPNVHLLSSLFSDSSSDSKSHPSLLNFMYSSTYLYPLSFAEIIPSKNIFLRTHDVLNASAGTKKIKKTCLLKEWNFQLTYHYSTDTSISQGSAIAYTELWQANFVIFESLCYLEDIKRGRDFIRQIQSAIEVLFSPTSYKIGIRIFHEAQ